MGSYKLLFHYYYKHILSTCPDMKFSAVLLVLACAYSAYGADKLKCLEGTLADVMADTNGKLLKDCTKPKCSGPTFVKDEGYGTPTVDFACGECGSGKKGAATGQCAEDTKTIEYVAPHKLKCYEYTYDKTKTSWVVKESGTGDAKKKEDKDCSKYKKDDVQCKKPFGDQAADAGYDVCGKCPAKSEKSCTNCAEDLCNSAGALVASLVPLLALLYTLL